jgi:hypothetical protein
MRPRSARQTEEINLLELGVSYLKTARLWWRQGDIPPPSHYWSFAIALALIASGLLLLRSSFLPKAEQPGRAVRAGVLFVLGVILAAPGVYCIFLSVCCWRRLGNYDWWMIPHFS